MASEKLTDSIRQDWDERARKDAFHYIASWRSDWDLDSFFQSGEEDYQRLVEPILRGFNFDPAGKAMVELGCGAGRMTRVFAQRFARISAVDISSEMQQRGKEYLREFSNIRWVLADGATLSGIDSDSCDFVFSYLVLQHLPDSMLAHDLLREIVRVLRPGGVFLVQYNGAPKPSMNWTGRAAWSVVNALWSIGWKSAGRKLAAAMKFDPEMAGKSWHGVALTTPEVRAVVQSAGVANPQFSGEGTPMAWCCGVKTAEAG